MSAARPLLHPRALRLIHWVNAVAIIIMVMSGLAIHNAHPTLPFEIPAIMTLGGGLIGALNWHFAAMWVLTANFLVWLAYGLLTGRFRRKLLPLKPGELIADIRAALGGHLAHADLSRYNAVQKLLYLGVIALIALVILTGLSIWKPVQFQALTLLFGDFDTARLIHFIAMALIAGFILVHVTMALLVPQTLRAMILGR